MEWFLIILAGLLILLSVAGNILPGLPGTPLGYVGLLVLHATDKVQFSTTFLIVWAVIVIVVQVLDYVVPAWGTKKFGGSKAGVWGSTIGLVLGLFMGPWGIIIGPFIGAMIGELINGKEKEEAIKAAWGSFIGLLAGTTLKLICSGFMIYYYIEALVK